MSLESCLLLFDAERPLWTRELIALAGEEPGDLEALAGMGLLAPGPGEAWGLTGPGRERFRRWAAESFLEAEPGCPPPDPELALLRLEAGLRLDRGFHSPHGAKEYRLGVSLPWEPSRGAGAASPGEGRTSSEHLSGSVGPGGMRPRRLDLDVLFLHRYDYAYYLDAPVAGDVLGLANADRLFCRILREGEARALRGGLGPTDAPDGCPCPPRALREDLENLRGFLDYARRDLLPGRFDTDSQEQGANTWWVWMPESEEGARAVRDALAPSRGGLIGPSAPLDFWILSLEALRANRDRPETFYELFDALATPVARAVTEAD